MSYYDRGKFLNRIMRWAIRRQIKALNYGKSLDELYKLYYKESRMYGTLADFEMSLKYALTALYLADPKDKTRWAEARLNYADACFSLISDDYPKIGAEGFYLTYEVISDLENKCDSMRDWELLYTAYYAIGSAYALMEKYDEAYKYASMALNIAKNQLCSNKNFLITSLEQISHANFAHGRLTRAWEYGMEELRVIDSDSNVDTWSWIVGYAWVVYMGLACGKTEVSKIASGLLDRLCDKPEYIIKIQQEHLRLSYLRNMRNEVDLCISALIENPDAFSMRDFYTKLLKISNVDAEISHLHTKFFQSCQSPEIIGLKAQTDRLRREVASIKSAEDIDEGALINGIFELREAENELTKLLTKQKIKNPFEDVSAEKIQRRLNEDEVLLEYGTFRLIDKGCGKTEGYKSYYYAVLVTYSNVELKLVGEVPEIDGLIDKLRNEIINFTARQDDSIQIKLYECLLKPFVRCIGSVKKLYIVPDKELYRLPFEILHDTSSPAIHETIESIIYLSSGRDLLKEKRVVNTDCGITVIANPKFDLELSEQFTDESDGISDNNYRTQRGNLFAELPYTQVEAEKISDLFLDKAEFITDSRATANSLFGEHKGHLLHISTHGIALSEETDGSAEIINYPMKRFGLNTVDIISDPLSKCGLIFAGRNNWLKGQRLPKDFGEGMLTGIDIMSCDLSRYDLIVLSACQTGLGEIQSGEGVKGLRKAFSLAGGGIMITTLWNVPDFVSAVFMEYFYDVLLNGKDMDVAAALLKTKKFIKNASTYTLAERGWGEYIVKLFDSEKDSERILGQQFKEREKPLSHPIYWAGYVIHGQ